MTRNSIDYKASIAVSGKTIYDKIRRSEKELWIPDRELERLLINGLNGANLKGLPLRTRSKHVKTKVCESLGYPLPIKFEKTKPRFPGQDFDTYTQKANNLQIWNEELKPSRRYAIIRVNDNDEIVTVRVVRGNELERLDTTGTLTQKYQAKIKPEFKGVGQLCREDTDRLKSFVKSNVDLKKVNPTDEPDRDNLFSISEVYKRLKGLEGRTLKDAGYDQERNRAASLHKLATETLGFKKYQDKGQFPDIPNQLLEVKLQTSPTIDLGLVKPDDVEEMEMPEIGKKPIRHCDARYAIFYASTDGKKVKIEKLHLVTGEKFFEFFQQFQGRVVNKKIQIPLPKDFFS